MAEQMPNTHESIEAYVAERQTWLADAVEVVTGSRDGDPMVVFPEPPAVRREAPMPDWTAEQEAAVREVAGRFGVGGEVDVPSGAPVEVLEGGLAWKIMAEAAIANGSRVYAGTPHRPTNEAEAAFMAQKLPEGEAVPETEYALADRIARLDPGFTPLDPPEVQPFGYDIQDGFRTVHEPTGQLTKIGANNGQAVYTLRVDQENFVNEAGENKFRNRPENKDLLGFVADVMEAQGGAAPMVGLVTTNTYPSRAIETVHAGLVSGRQFTVGMYGRQTLAAIKGVEVAPPETNQLPGELHVLADKLLQLQVELETRNDQS